MSAFLILYFYFAINNPERYGLTTNIIRGEYLIMKPNTLNNVAIVILNYNNANLSIQTTKHLIKDLRELHIIIVDNCSKDNSKEILSNEFYNTENVPLIFNKTNYGYAHGNNVGIEYAQSMGCIDYVAIMNPDVLLDVCIIDKLVKALEDDSNIGFITTEVYYNGVYNIPNECAWRIPTLFELVTFCTFLGYIGSHYLTKMGCSYNSQGYYSSDYYKNKRIALVDAVQGCFFMGRISTFMLVGKLDENTFLYYEENILASKIKKIGKSNAVLLGNYIHHNHHEKDVKLIKKTSKIFDMTCLHKSRGYYIKQYSRYSLFTKTALIAFLKIDYFIRKIVVSLTFED